MQPNTQPNSRSSSLLDNNLSRIKIKEVVGKEDSDITSEEGRDVPHELAEKTRELFNSRMDNFPG